MKLDIINLDGDKKGSVELNKDVFGLKVRKDLIARVYNWQFANSHYGSKKTKSIKDVMGTTKKPWKQKGTGRARQGSLRSAQMRGGGLAHAYHKIYNPIKLNKKVRILGLKHALSDKVASKNVIVVDSFKLDKVATNDMAKKVEKLNLGKILFVGNKERDENFYLSVRNIKNTRFLEEKAINVMSILRCRNVVLTKEALQSIEEKITGFNRIAGKKVEKVKSEQENKRKTKKIATRKEAEAKNEGKKKPAKKSSAKKASVKKSAKKVA
jgi:large subunit ribosomal protein L4